MLRAHHVSPTNNSKGRWLLRPSRRVLDPLERSSEVLFGVIMVLTFTGSISVAEGDASETRTLLFGAISCNLAWGIVDAVMYLMASLTERARGWTALRTIRSSDPHQAYRLIEESLPLAVAGVLTPVDVENVRNRLTRQSEPLPFVPLTRKDFAGALGVFLLVFLATFPIVIPFLVLRDVAAALRTSNVIALAMLFITGWSVGQYAGRPGWRTGLMMVLTGIMLVAITMALGG
jgi:hypothetical protein